MKKHLFLIGGLITLLTLLVISFYIKQSTSPNLSKISSQKTVEDYFIEHMHVSSDEAQKMAADGVMIRLSKNSTLPGIIENLYYYGFIEDRSNFKKLLENSTDKTLGNQDSIRIGNNSIDINSNYYLSYSLSEGEIADTLLNKAQFEPNFTRYDYLFMPSGPGTGNNERPEK